MKFLLEELEFYYINLDQDREKSRRIEIKLDLLGVEQNKIHRVRAHQNSESHIGILSSQIEALEMGLANKKPFVVLEDDVDVNNYVDSFSINDQSECTYLGLSRWGLYFSSESLARLDSIESFQIDGFDQICRIKNMFSAHSILYTNENYTRELLKNLHLVRDGKPFVSGGKEYVLKYYNRPVLPCDIVMAVMQNHHFITALKNPFFYQVGEHDYCTRFNID